MRIDKSEALYVAHQDIIDTLENLAKQDKEKAWAYMSLKESLDYMPKYRITMEVITRV